MNDYDHQYIKVNGIHLHVVFAGPEDGEPVILLHGFPEFWYGWKNQIPFLAEKGYRVIVPDQRGYNLSDKPDGVKNYVIDTLAQDIDQLATVLGYDKINLVGHDWGAMVAWWVATLFPNRLKQLVILNVPYPTVWQQHVRSSISQMLKSWYVAYFQIPVIPETLASLGNYRQMAAMLKQSSNPDTFSNDDIEQYRGAWSQPDALKSMINWYRAIRHANLKGDNRITTPTLMLWGENDIALTKELAQPSIDLCEDGELIFYPNATHWVQHDEAAAVNEEIHRFMSNGAS